MSKQYRLRMTESDLISSAYDRCFKVYPTDTFNMKMVDFHPNPFCRSNDPDDFELDQSSGVEALCLVPSLEKTIIEKIVELGPNQRQRLGFESQNDEIIRQQLLQRLENDCHNQSPIIKAHIGDTPVQACKWHFVQNASKKTSCYISVLQNIAIQIQSLPPEEELIPKNNNLFVITMIIILIVIIIGILLCLFL